VNLIDHQVTVVGIWAGDDLPSGAGRLRMQVQPRR
jgi:hypothetical protein